MNGSWMEFILYRNCGNNLTTPFLCFKPLYSVIQQCENHYLHRTHATACVIRINGHTHTYTKLKKIKKKGDELFAPHIGTSKMKKKRETNGKNPTKEKNDNKKRNRNDGRFAILWIENQTNKHIKLGKTKYKKTSEWIKERKFQ